MSKPIIVALDNMTTESLLGFCRDISGHLDFAKVGMEAFYKEGHGLIKKLHDDYQLKIFLDLKLHDIPNTVAKAIHSLAGLPVKFLTIHASGGEEMMKAAAKAAKESLPDTTLLAVTYLTSLTHQDLKSIYGIESDQIESRFSELLTQVQDSGVHGVVCSGQELPLFKGKHCDLTKVCPGIRLPSEIASGKIGDQKRVMGPRAALKEGAQYLVMGRSLTQSPNLSLALEELQSELQ